MDMLVMQEKLDEMMDLLVDIQDFLEGQEDVVDGDYGAPAPNRAMVLNMRIKEILK